MQVVDLPRPCDEELRDEAFSRYAALVKSRAIAVYRVDDGVLVLTTHIALDNRFFFSALERLPSRHQRCFLREPYILPAWSMRVVQYTSHSPRRLIAGRDVLEPYVSDDGPNERWCRKLEWYCACATFNASVNDSQILNARHLMGAVRDLACAAPDEASLLTKIASDADEPQIRKAWDGFCAAFERFDRSIRASLGVAPDGDALSKARNCLAGEESCEHFDREYAFQRARDIDGYHQELASLGFPYGHLFAMAAYPATIRMPGMSVVDSVVSQIYRLRRRLTEYAAAPQPA
jgi:hypothetical protein